MNDPFPKKSEEISELEKMNKLGGTKEDPEYLKILKKYGMLESNIPINSPYWKIRP